MSSAALNPIRHSSDWMSVSIANTINPGACQVSGFKREYGWDVKTGKGTLGATLTFNHAPPAEGSIKFYLWTEEHFDMWTLFRPLFKYDPTKKGTTAVDIYYPSLADIGVNSVVCKSIGAIEHEGKGLYSCTVELIEYSPPPKASSVSTPSTSKSNDTKSKDGITADPIADAKQKQIADLSAELAKP